MSDTVKITGFEADVVAVHTIAPVAYSTSSSEVLSTAVDTRLYPRKKILAVLSNAADATSTGVTILVKESATSGGTYANATTTGTLGAATAAGTRFVAVKRNAAKPWIKLSFTPAGGSGVLAGAFIFLP